MVECNSKPIEREEVDISHQADELMTFSLGTLDEIDQYQKILAHWQRQRIIVWLSVFVIIAALLTSIGLLAFSNDEAARDWSKQIFATLVGFAAGAMWPNSKSSDQE